MFDWLIAIPGPIFLLIFSIYALFIILFAILARRVSLDSLKESYEPTNFSYYDLAYLRGGIRRVVRTALVIQLQRKRVKVTNIKDRGYRVCFKNLGANSRLDPITQKLRRFIRVKRSLGELYSKEFIANLEQEVLEMEENLIRLGLYEKKRVLPLKVVNYLLFSALLLALGGTKLYFGLLRDKPSFFLIILLILSLSVLALFLFQSKRGATIRGALLLREAGRRFRWALNSREQHSMEFLTDFAYASAIFPLKMIKTGIFKGLNPEAFEPEYELIPGLLSLGGAAVGTASYYETDGFDYSQDGGRGGPSASGGSDDAGGAGGCGGCGQ